MKTAEQIAIEIKIANRGNILDVAELVEAIKRDRAQTIEALEDLKEPVDLSTHKATPKITMGGNAGLYLAQDLIREAK